jgi:ribonuclease HII
MVGDMKKEERIEYERQRLLEMSVFENALYERGVTYIGGIDEVGRGSLAGPVCAACVVLPQEFSVPGVDDSKKLSEKRRETLYDQIIDAALACGIGFVENGRIDEINILNATKEAMVIAVAEAQKALEAKTGADNRVEHLLIDAIDLKEANLPLTAIIKGDSKSVSVAAASIVAKVTRDRLMIRFDKIYPGYAFASNKGYGTKAHYEGLSRLGSTPIHRRTFL